MEAYGKEGCFRVSPKQTRKPSASQKEKSLVVVEDVLISKLVRTVLQKHGYSVVTVGPSEATGILRSATEPDEILLTNAPSHFLEFAERIPLLYLTSSPDPDVAAAFRSCRVVRKPFSPNELVEAVESLSGESSD
jgi:CheY-like chemotaxis protein